MIDQALLTPALRAEVTALEDDLRQRLGALPEIEEAWRAQHAASLRSQRTVVAWESWADERITQAAVAWVLATVFLRFAEDNHLVRPVWIGGGGPRRQEALDAQAVFLRETARTHGDATDREWLRAGIDHLAGLPATRDLVDASSALWLITPSGDGVARLLGFWRQQTEDGTPRWDFTDPSWDTRFLGDLYQNLSEAARSQFALLQTPEFVEEFILDQTLEPALKDHPLAGFRMIDPTCGSGHFLLGAFERLHERWAKTEPGLDARARVQKALDAIHGVDLNPFAVAIARFRLTIAAMRASGDTSLEIAPDFHYHLAVGDSLLHGEDQQDFGFLAFETDKVAAEFAYATENLGALREILVNGRYDCVVGNPPYITVKDKALNELYRKKYGYCKGKYALTVPFMEKFFRLAKSGERPGWVGQITSNSFMKREFGAPIIEQFLTKQDLRLVADTSGAYIPGHGTPTVIIVGRNAAPVGTTARAALGVRGEPGRPDDPAKGLVWTALTEHINEPGHSDDWVTIADLNRSLLGQHPWSLSGGGAVELVAAVTRSEDSIGHHVRRIGFYGVMGADDAMTAPVEVFRRAGVELRCVERLVVGDEVRDWEALDGDHVFHPYDAERELIPLDSLPSFGRRLWPLRTGMGNRATFTKGTYFTDGRPWWEWHQLPKDDGAHQWSIAFAFVATHNHFVLDRGGKVFKQSAPVIKLPAGASEDDHLALLGVLNSSTACFWLKQNSHNKGRPGAEAGGADEPWEQRFEFTGTTLQDFPLPATLPIDEAKCLDELAQRFAALSPASVVEAGVPSRSALDDARRERDVVRAEMVARQEELDWQAYQLYGLVDEDLTYPGNDVPGLRSSDRAFAIVMARREASGDLSTSWFDHHNHKFDRVTEVPARWPAAYQDLVQRRIALIESHPYLRLLEKPEYKRRWAGETWEKQEERAVRGWLLDRLEDRRFWFDRHGAPTVRSVQQLADEVGRDADLTSVLALWEGRPDIPVGTSLGKLLAPEGVPFLAAYRYKDTGLRKRAAWERTWELQRREDAGQTLADPIPVPPKYTSADFAKKEYWAHRGKLDVPKERFILYPDASRSTDPTPVLGWAGWDHAQQAFALDQLIGVGESDGWSDDKLTPLVAGLHELLPWVTQWHTSKDAFYGGLSAAEFFATSTEERTRNIAATPDQLTAWRPTAAKRGGRPRKVDSAKEGSIA